MRRTSPRLVQLESRDAPAVINFSLTTGSSTLSLSGTLDGNAFTQQGAGSLTTTYSGTIPVNVDFTGNTIEFLATGSLATANNSGTWAPAIGGGSAFSPGSDLANYGANVTVSGLGTKVAARFMVAQFSSGANSLAGAGASKTFASNQSVAITAGSVDYNNLLLQGNAPLAGSGGPNAASDGTFTDNGNGTYALVMPASATINDSVNGLPLILNIIGKFNATAVLPVADLNGAAAGFDSTWSFSAGGAATKIAPAATITRTPSANLTGMTVTLVSPPDGANESLAGDVTGTGLTLTPYDPFSGQLVISGNGTLAQYQSVLQKITFSDSLASPTTGARTVTVAVTDAGNTSIERTAGGTVNAAAPAAKVASIKIGDGTAQRSIIQSLTLTFDSKITLPGAPASAFTLVRQSDSAAVTLAAAVNNSGPTTVVTLTFSGPATDFTSLADGRYTLTGLASQINGGAFDGNGDGTAGDNYVLASAAAPAAPTNIWRHFGDIDGDNDVDATDYSQFLLAYSGVIPIFAFNFDNDGDVDTSDFGAFRARFGTSI